MVVYNCYIDEPVRSPHHHLMIEAITIDGSLQLLHRRVGEELVALPLSESDLLGGLDD